MITLSKIQSLKKKGKGELKTDNKHGEERVYLDTHTPALCRHCNFDKRTGTLLSLRH